MNLVRIATRIAEQTRTSLPVKHDVSQPLFNDEDYEKDLAKLLEHAEALAEGVDGYLESIKESMESDGSVLPEELVELESKRPEHAKAICTMLIDKVCAPEEEEEGEGAGAGAGVDQLAPEVPPAMPESPEGIEEPAPEPVPEPEEEPVPEPEEEEEEEVDAGRQQALREISEARKHRRK